MSKGVPPSGSGCQPAASTVSSTASSQSGIPNAWQHTLEDGSFDHEWVTEFGVTFCTHCEQARDYDE